MSKQSCRTSELRLLLLGKCRSGKSATGNAILGKDVFASKFGDQIVTTVCQRESQVLRERKVVVIDTPDLFSPVACAEDKQRNIQHCLELSAPSLHALLLVITIGHFTREDEETVTGIQQMFGAEARRHIIIVFTQKDNLGADLLQGFIKNHESLKQLVQDCGGRYCIFSKADTEDERVSQVSELLHKVEDLVKMNRGPYHVNLKTEGSRFQDCVNEASSQEGDKPHGPRERQLQSTGPEQNPGTSELTVLLVGKRGAGKSAAGNSILGRRAFETGFSKWSVTQSFSSESRRWRKKKVLIIDAPDISSLRNIDSELKRHTYPGPHAFLLVTPLGFYNEDDEAVLNTIQSSFGEKCFEYMVILFTRKEDLRDQDLEKFLRNSNKSLCCLIQKCGDRYSAFNYRATAEEEQRQVDELLQKIDSVVHQNGNKHCIFREKETLSIVLVGRSGTGKSATGNSILGRLVFISQLRAKPVTKNSQSGSKTWDGQEVVVVDTPSFSQMLDVEKDRSQLVEEFKHCLSCCEKGDTFFVLVFQLGRFTEEDKTAVAQLEGIFGASFMDYTVVLFTRKEDLGAGKLEDFIKNSDNKALKNIIKKCGWRICAFNNKETGQAQETQVKALLAIVNDLRRKHEWSGYLYPWENTSKPTKNVQEISQAKKFFKSLKDMLP
ncbi:GTPase IMAP family member 8 isoform X2 [Saimiri boliviensis]|uniref:GTPase IMAP family member 8 n=2 Tax=Saimiri boliviensis TaxID=27679 RepID=A0A2K6TXM7_SAIBB|nr:GTPase IMAP family member 8 isoform X2 [Saimiri boliviensis boliviensis]XP_039328967.1 GTPase IMAP family member 8 isoform X2 [Saimiri boliviensis boliviensis]XP_039328968.1 GTPase IMAP family member 8 isoform X2 [Saimiri boliviensis boliviensis]